MDDCNLIQIEPVTDGARQCRCCVSGQTSDAINIGGMWFTEAAPPLHETCRDIFERGKEPQRVADVIELLNRLFPVGLDTSLSDSHRFADEPFIPFDLDSLTLLGRLLAGGSARLRKSRITISHDDPAFTWDMPGKMGPSSLSTHQRRVLRILEMRRGRVGEPLEVFWQAVCHLGLAQSAQERRRDYGCGYIPKLEIGNHLFQIERKPLLEQVRQIRHADCFGLVWISENYAKPTALTLELEALTFDHVDKVDEMFRSAYEEMSRRIHEALSHAPPLPVDPFGRSKSC